MTASESNNQSGLRQRRESANSTDSASPANYLQNGHSQSILVHAQSSDHSGNFILCRSALKRGSARRDFSSGSVLMSESPPSLWL